MSNPQASYASPKLEARLLPDKGGWGVYAREWIRAGELLSVWAGEIFNGEQLARISSGERRYAVQVEEDLYLVTVREPETADFINHCCSPNAGLSGQLALVALHDIAPEEEVCFDYAMTDGSVYDEFPCSCGAAHCRGWVTGGDWMKPELWQRYGNHFSPYLLRRIERLKRTIRRPAVTAPVFAPAG